jgi:hypothetical protein
MIDDECGAVGGMKNWKGKPKYSEKTCPSATLCTTKTTRLDLGSNQGRRGEKPATNRLSYGAALAVTVRKKCKAIPATGRGGP